MDGDGDGGGLFGGDMYREGKYAYTIAVEKVSPVGADRFAAKVTQMIHYTEYGSKPINGSQFQEQRGGTEDEARDNMRQTIRDWVASQGS